MKKLLISNLVFSIIFGVMLLSVGTASAATTWYVDDDCITSPGSGTLADPYCKIQDAIDVAVAGDTIEVADGTYNESVVVDEKDLSLIAPSDGVIIFPDSCAGHGDAIQVYNGSVSIQGFIVDATNCLGGIYAMAGFSDRGPVRLTALDNTVYSYKKNGITVNGPGAYGDIQGNDVMGSGPIGVPYYAQNGIQFGYGATGQAMENSVAGNWYIGPDWGATGILVFESDRVLIQENTVEDCGTGVAMEAWGWLSPSANYNIVMNNSIVDAQYGVSVAAYDWAYTTMDVFADNNKIANNSIVCETDDGDTGIFVGVANGPGTYKASADNNKVIHNVIEGYTTAIEEKGMATKVHANVVSP